MSATTEGELHGFPQCEWSATRPGARIKAAIVFGTRPEAIKLATVAHALADHAAFELKIISTGQHRDMVGPVCQLFDLKVDDHLDVMKPGQSLAYLTSSVVEGMNSLFDKDKPDVVIVQGDTTTAFAAALAAFYHKVPVAHVEAGLRTHDLYSPWPEEANRVLISRIAAYHYPPTPAGAANLRAEGISEDAILMTGNTVIDAARYVEQRQSAEDRQRMSAKLGIEGRDFILFTMHRRESFGEGVERVFRALDELTTRHGVDVLFPVHPNPNIIWPANAILSKNPRVRLVAPLDYAEMVFALANCRFVITDSGGLVEEAPTFGKPALVLRETTERGESIESGSAILIGTDAEKLTRFAGELITGGPLLEQMRQPSNPFGDGLASARIASHLARALGGAVDASSKRDQQAA